MPVTSVERSVMDVFSATHRSDIARKTITDALREGLLTAAQASSLRRLITRSSLEPSLATNGSVQRGFLIRKKAGEVCRFFENVEQGLRAVNAVAFGLCRLLHNFDTLQPLDCSLCGCEGNAQLVGNARGGDEWIGRQQIDNPQRGVGGLAS